MDVIHRNNTFKDAVSALETENWAFWERIKWDLSDREFQELQDEYGTDKVF